MTRKKVRDYKLFILGNLLLNDNSIVLWRYFDVLPQGSLFLGQFIIVKS